MGKTLFIAEKYKVAQKLLKSPRFKNLKKVNGTMPYYGYFENEDYIVSWCQGHLLRLKYPEEIDSKYKEFDFEHLPILLEPHLKVIEETEEQLNILVELLNREDVDLVVNSCDKDKEGELIYREVYSYAGVDKNEKRIFTASYEPAELEAALNNLLPGEEFDALASAANARQYLDYALGINITRGCTTKLANNQFLLSSGRVQMCLLNEIRQREIARQNYKEQTSYNLKVLTAPGCTAVMKTEEQILDSAPLIQLATRIKDTQLVVKEFSEKERKKQSKSLYNLTDIYKDALAKLKISPEVANKHIQHLYEEGFISYPRSSSRHLPREQVNKVKEIITVLEESNYKEFANMIDISTVSEKHSSFNDELVNSHYAVIPTTKKYDGANKNELEQKLYELIVKRFISNFMPPAIYLVREASFVDQEGNEYVSKERLLQEKGFLSVFQEDEEEDDVKEFKIPMLSENDRLLIVNHELITSKSKKPALHTESTMLTFMESAGKKLEDQNLKELMKGKRIGTVATEAKFIPTLENRGYIAIENGKISTTEIGRAFVDTFPVEQVKNPEYTAELEGMITSIENKEMDYNEFVLQTNSFVEKVVEQLGNIDSNVAIRMVNTHNKQIEICTCKCKKGKIINKGKFYGCSTYPNCEMSIPKKIKGKNIPEEQIKKLFKDKKTDLIKGFESEKGKFDAYLAFHEGRVRLALPTIDELSLGRCPKCQKGKILSKEKFYGCSDYKNGCDYSFPIKLKGKLIPKAQIKKLFSGQKTDFINGFQSEKGEYTAALQLKDGKPTFIFPTIDDRTLGKCPLCRSRVLVGTTNYKCEHYNKTCDFKINGTYLGKNITNNHIKKLLEKNLTDMIKGLKSNKTGKEFDARLSYSVAQKRLTCIFEK
ncbi:DNA topoisomerase [Bacillus thuringiensis]|uniref:type IA DNA topoisomerase n=2 Tax=Bacillus thuringiensis TaxID=1428 RepID=UPI00208F47B5|nr:type IA DNA topoisomerase [Bacillus thuringiensis]MEB4894323.1 DNA topoisomerase [Bacillus thuringiensis]MEC2562887.1 DNA topoisomerase [Bacillus thuringiensis]MEC2726625.1 DNA topoisomerase [Bacillus thuringiensis]MEC2752351.1 DNA topoisomerase [Bacillus thuringiensis]MEC2770169.1 DNA topoisomerase [Bacillus thuringiensis]